MVNLTINGTPIEVPESYTILQAAKAANIEIPTLCYLKDINCIGSCRICVVEVAGRPGLVAACVNPVSEGMEVFTNTPKVRKSRKTTLELLLSDHRKKCLSCVKSGACELQRLAREYNVDEDYFGHEPNDYEIDNLSPYLVRDNSKCILCRRCVAACKNVQGISVIGAADRGFKAHIACAFEKSIAQSPCVGCGQCIVACPVGALYEKSSEEKAWSAISDPAKKVVVFTAPSIRATLGEVFDMPVGTNVEGKMISAIRALGVDEVYNMDVTADLTIMEEGTEFIGRIKGGEKLPLMTSCCPGWVNFVEHYYPEFIPNLSSCKSPQQMFGAVLKSYYCEKNNIDPDELFVISIIPCTAKKFEVERSEFNRDVDISLTTREIGRMIKTAGLNFASLPDSEYDNPFDTATGAGAIFGATGGVMEAALRTASELLEGKSTPVDFEEVRGTAGIKEAVYNIAGKEIKVAVASGLANARAVLESIKNGEKEYDFIEVMACPGGCINGGGQPYLPDSVRNSVDLKSARSAALYKYDESLPHRKSHESPVIKMLYDEYFEAPGKEKAHQLLHTAYVKREKY